MVLQSEDCISRDLSTGRLPFGSVASVTAFLRCALGIWLMGANCKVLGIELTLTKSLSGIVTVCNTQSRCDELIAFMEEVLAAGVLTRCEGERLRGRLQFASNQLFGSRFRNCLRELNSTLPEASGRSLMSRLRHWLLCAVC